MIYNKIQKQGNLVIKTFTKPERMIGEFFGLTLAGLIIDQCPQIVVTAQDKLAFEKFGNSLSGVLALKQGLINKKQINKFVLNFCTESIKAFEGFDESKKNKLWNLKVLELIKSFEENQETFSKFVPGNICSNLKCKLWNLLNAKYNTLCLLHRDIHLDNILVNKATKKLSLIDFEHSLIGPIELEFQNSLFWSDKKSIDLKSITKRVCGYNYELQKELRVFYIAEQLVIAAKNNDQIKLKTISARLRNKRMLKLLL